jgi:predicted RNA-binding Zn ribbon-like protein
VDDESGLLVELLNTTPDIDGAIVDQLADDNAAKAWSAARRGGVGTRETAEALRSLRGDLQAVLRGERPPQVLAPLLDGVARHPEIGDEGLRWRLDVPEDRALLVRIVLAWADVTERLPGRLRPCANSECNRFLLDRSRAGTARWCSMAVCGNRLKARRHQARRSAD